MPISLRFLLPLLLVFCGTAHSQSWEDITANTGAVTLGTERNAIVSHGGRLYAIGGPDGSGVLVSEDNGNTFTPINTVAGAGYALNDGNSLHTLRIANGRLWVTGTSADAAFNYLHWLTPGETSWQQGATGGFPPPAQLGGFGTITDVVYDDVSSRYFAIAEIGGVWSSADGATWEERTSGFGGIGAPASLATVDGALFALRPLSGLRRSTDAGLSWHANSPHTGADGGQLRRAAGGVSFIVTGPSSSSIAYHTKDGGQSWITVPGLPPGMGNNLSGDGELLFTRTATDRFLFSATGGLSWQDLPTDGIQLAAPVWPDTDYTGVFSPLRIERHGDFLFVIGTEYTDASFNSTPKLYRIDLTGFDWRAETVILAQPRNRGNFAGGNITLDVFAVGHDLTYQWFKGATPIPGADGSSLTLSEITAGDAGEYHVVVTGARGTVTSQTVTVEVRAERIDGQFDLTYEPKVTAGGDLHLLADGTILRVGTSVPSFIARMDSEGNELNSRGLSAGLPTQEQIVPRFHFIDEEGRLVVAGYTSGSNTSSNQRLRRFDPVTLEADPSFPIVSGFDATINSIAELPGRGYLVSGQFNAIGGTPVSRVALITYGGVVDPDYGAGMNLTPHEMIAGVDGTAYIRGNFGGTPYRRFIRLDRRGQVVTDFPAFTEIVEFMRRLDDGRLFLVTNKNGNRTVVILQPNGLPDPAYTPAGTFDEQINAVAEQPDGKLILVGEFTEFAGEPARGHIRLLPSGERDPDYHASTSFSGNIFFSLNIADALYVPGYVFLSHSGDSSAFQGYPNLNRGPVRVLAQQPDLAILRQSLSRQEVPGSNITLSVQAHGSTAVSYQWLLDGEELPGETNPTITLTGLDATMAGLYTVRITNESGVLVSQPIELTLVGGPEILTAPDPADLLAGEDHTLSVEADGASPLAYQWLLNGEEIPGAESASLELTNVQPGDAGLYSVIVSNPFGQLTTTPVAVTVNTVTGVRDTAFVPNPNNQVHQVLRRPDGALVVRGTFTSVGGGSAARFAFLDPDTGALVPDINHGGFSHNVNGMAIQSDGKVVVGGQFTNALSSGRNRLVRLKLDGTIDETFNSGGDDPSNTVLGVWVLSDDSILVNSGGGTYRGASVGPLYRLFPDGSLDTDWNANVGAGPVSANDIYAIAEQPDGSLVIGGAFGGFAGLPGSSYLVRVLPDGSPDTDFIQTRPLPNYYVRAVAVQPDGKILVAGEFNNVGSANPAYRKIVRLHPDGSLDTTFPANTTTSTGQHVYAMQLLPDGKILLGGSFSSWPGANSSHAGARTVLLNSDGAVNPFYRPGQFNNTVWTLLALPEGRFYAGGAFTSPGGRLSAFSIDATPLAITRQPRSVVADLGGSAEFEVGIHTSDTASFQWFKNDESLDGETSATLTLAGLTRDDAGDYSVRVTNPEADVTVFSRMATLTVLAEPVIITSPTSITATPASTVTFTVEAIGAGELTYQWFHNDEPVIGGDTDTLVVSNVSATDAGFYHVEVSNDLDDVASNPIALAVAARIGAPDPSFTVPGDGPNSSILVITPLSSGRIALGGAFTRFSGEERYRFALLEADGSLVDLPSNPLLTDGGATAIIEQPDGKMLIGWGFGWQRHNPDGTHDTGFNPESMQVNAMVIDDTHAYVGGYKGSSQSSLRRFSLEDGEEDKDFTANTAASGFLGVRTTALHLRADGTLIAANEYGLVRRLLNDGTIDPDFTAPTAVNVHAIHEMPDGKLWIAGGFSTVGGQARGALVRLNPDGSLDTSFSDLGLTRGNTTHPTGWRLLRDGVHLYLAGDFTYTSGDQNWGSLLRLSTETGLVDETFGPVMDTNAGRALAIDAQGRLLLGGLFTAPVNRLMRITTGYDGDFSIVGQPKSITAKPGAPASFSVAWIGGGAAAYQWYRDGDPIANANGQEFVLPAVAESDGGDYHVTITIGTETLTSTVATLTVAEESGEPDPAAFEAWPALASLPPDQRGPLDNPAGDGLPNLLKFVLGLDPAIPSGSPVHVPDSLITVDGEEFPLMTFTRRKEIGDIVVAVEVSSGLEFADELGSEIVDVLDNGDGTETVTVRSATPASIHARQFMRLRATLP